MLLFAAVFSQVHVNTYVEKLFCVDLYVCLKFKKIILCSSNVSAFIAQK